VSECPLSAGRIRSCGAEDPLQGQRTSKDSFDTQYDYLSPAEGCEWCTRPLLGVVQQVSLGAGKERRTV